MGVLPVEDRKPLQQQVIVVNDGPAAQRGNEPGHGAGGDNRCRHTQLLLHSLAHTVQHGGGTQHDAAAHGIVGIAADGPFGPVKLQAGQQRRSVGEGIQ